MHDRKYMSVIFTTKGDLLRTGSNRALWLLPVIRTLLLALICFCTPLVTHADQEPEHITLQLKSRPYFQTAGFYTAQAKGFYRNQGLEVRILPGQAQISSLQSVIDKKVEYAISDLSVLTAYLEGKPVVALASILQHAPFRLLSLKGAGIHDIQDLQGKRIMVTSENGLIHLQLLLHQAGIPISAVTLVSGLPRAKELIAGHTDVIGVLSDWEMAILDDQRIPYNVIDGQLHGVDVYGHIVFTHKDEVRDHPERVDAFLRATRQGWLYAMDHPDEAARIIMQSGQAGAVTQAQLLRQADGMKKLVLADIVDIGHMNVKRWQQIADHLASTNLASSGKEIKPFLYDPAASQKRRWTQNIIVAAIVIAIVMALGLIWNLLMQRAVKRRTIALQEEIGKRVLVEQQLSESLRTDQLTNLPNRIRIGEYVSQLMDQCAATGQHAAMLFIDLSNFQRVTVTFGRDVSDRIIVEVTRVLSGQLVSGDFLSRVGRDQFILIPAFRHHDQQAVADYGHDYARRLQVPFQSLLRVQGHEQLISMNIGIALTEASCRQTDVWIKRAELAMHDAKKTENESIRFFDLESEKNILSRSTLELAIRQGLAQSEFLVYYQPQVDETGRTLGVEALIRWQAEGGMVNPQEFIFVAEESGQIIEIGAWMIDAVCRQLALWARHPDRQHLCISVNVSARQIHHPDFVFTVTEILERTAANPRKLRFEITESIFLKRSRDTMDKLRQLKAMGISLSMDDFGTGYSSFSYLLQQQLFSEIKIPRPFVTAALSNDNAGYIIDVIIRLARHLNMTIVAEGVETEEERAYLCEQGCRRFQGYLICPPVPLAQLEAQLEKDE